MSRWFRAQLVGSYVGEPSSLGPQLGGRRHRLRVYRASLRELRWLDAAPEASAADSGAAVLRQQRIEQAHVAGVRGAGSWYEGPVFDLTIEGVRLTHPTEKDGKVYGRVEGAAVGWLELPPEPPQPEVLVSVQPASEPLTAAEYHGPPALAAASGKASLTHPGSLARDSMVHEAEPKLEAHPEAGAGESDTPARARTPSLLPLCAAVAVVGLALLIGCGPLPMGLWALFMLPTLIARGLFLGVLRDGGFLRGFGYACIALQAFCVSQLVSSAWSSACPQWSLWPLLGVIAVLFPAGLLPSIIPLSCNALGLALVLATYCHGPNAACGQPRPAISAAQRSTASILRSNTEHGRRRPSP